MRHHQAASIVPLLDGPAYEALKEDIRQNGLQVPIVVWMDQLLDGRNRMRACTELGISPKLQELKSLPSDSPTMYVISANLHRRHLSPSQLAIVGARARQHFDAEARLRQARKSVVSALHGDARDLAGATVGVSGKTIDYATKVLKAGVPELVAACESGKLSVFKAAKLLDLPPDRQRKAIVIGNRAQPSAARQGEAGGVRSKGAAFDQLVARAREVRDLLGALGTAESLVRLGHFDRAVVLSAADQLETIGSLIVGWTERARQELSVAACHPDP